MITLLASIAGYIGSIIPELVKILKDKNDKKHELQILDRQIEYSKTASTQRIEEIQIQDNAKERASLYATYKSGVSWVDAINGLVRPLLAYSFFSMYACVKYLQYNTISSTAIPIEYIEIIWNVDDQAIFAGIISFYFGQRTFSKLLKQR